MTFELIVAIIRSLKYIRDGGMFIFFMVFGLILLISGGAGLFYTNANIVSGAPLWIMGNITFGTFAVLGVGILVFLAIFNSEFD